MQTTTGAPYGALCSASISSRNDADMRLFIGHVFTKFTMRTTSSNTGARSAGKESQQTHVRREQGGQDGETDWALGSQLEGDNDANTELKEAFWVTSWKAGRQGVDEAPPPPGVMEIYEIRNRFKTPAAKIQQATTINNNSNK